MQVVSLTRAFTMKAVRRNHFDHVDHPDMPESSGMSGSKPLQRNQSARLFDRSIISGPVLLSTTNVQYLNAMTVEAAQKQQIQSLRKMSMSSHSSVAASERDNTDRSSIGTRSRGTSVTEHSSTGGSNPSSPKPNDSPNNTYFSHGRPPSLRDDSSIILSRERSGSGASRSSLERGSVGGSIKKAKSIHDLKARTTSASFDPTEPLPALPAIPARNPGHSKFAHEQLAKKKSMGALSGSMPPQVQNKWVSPPRSVPDSEVMSATRMSRSSSNSSAMTKPMSMMSTTTNSTAHTSASITSNFSLPKRSLTLPVEPANAATATTGANSQDSAASLREQRASPDMFSADFQSKKSSHPFAVEIQQLDKIAEELVGTVRDAAYEDDMRVMKARNLHRWCAADYTMDLNPMWDNIFVPGHIGGGYMEPQQSVMVGWI